MTALARVVRIRATLRPVQYGLLVVAVAANLATVVHFVDQFWWPTDDGTYAHVAERLRHGEVLSRDIKEDHAGASHFLHAAAFALFGTDFVSMRYPLMAVTFAHSLVMLRLLWPLGALTAAAGSVASVALGTVQFLNPQPHWYCLFLVGLIAWLLERRASSPATVDTAVGYLVGLAYLFRQLTAVFIGIGVLVWMLVAIGPHAPPGRHGVTRAILVVLGLGLGWYVVQTDLFTLLLIGVWPLLIILLGLLQGRSEALPLIPLLRVGAGTLLALAPVVTYHLWHGSVAVWLDDTVVSAIGVMELSHLGNRWFRLMAIKAGFNLVAPTSPTIAVNGAYWLLLLFLPLVVGVHCVRTIRRDGFGAVRPLTVLAVFYALVALFNQIPIYLYYVVGLSAAGLLGLALRPRWRRTAPLVVLALSAVGLVYHAAQPLSRGLLGVLDGQRIASVPCGLARCSLHVDPADHATYTRVIARIDEATGPGEPIVAMPNSAELYFLSGRRNPLPFYNTALDVRSDSAVADVVDTISRVRPRVLVYAPDDRYATRHSEAIVRAVAHLYRPPERIGQFALYVLAEPR